VTTKFSFAPARLWRAFCFNVATVALLATAAHAQPGYQPPPDLGQFGRPDPAEAKRILEQFRSVDVAGNSYLEFQLRVLPRRGAERTYNGRMWRARTAQGPVSRVSITADGTEYRLLIQDGPEPGVWQWHSGPDARVEMLGVAALFTPLAKTDLTPFDLGRSYLYWPNAEIERIARVGGRPAHQFLLHPPAEFAAKYPALSGVRIYCDAQYGALVQYELLGAGERVLKSMSVLELKRLGDDWMVKAIDLRDEATRNKTRFVVTGAALNQNFPSELFSPAALGEDMAPPPSGKITRIP
jgi:hypothetical protein